jgi:hypothetical protein
MDLSNEDAEKALLVQLADRNLISDELIQMKFGIDPNMEKYRLNRENRDRDAERMVPKAGPYYDANFENNLKKIALQLGIVTPSQVGLELDPKKRGEITGLEMKAKFPTAPKIGGNPGSSSPIGISGEGRPKNSKDSQQRKERDFAPRTGASLAIWANEAQDKISEIVNPMLLEFYNKDNLRKLSAKESKELDDFKTKILLGLEINSSINEININKAISQINHTDIISKFNSLNYWIKQISNELNRTITSEENKLIKSSFYSAVYS